MEDSQEFPDTYSKSYSWQVAQLECELSLSNFCFQLEGVRNPASTSKGLAETKFSLTTHSDQIGLF